MKILKKLGIAAIIASSSIGLVKADVDCNGLSEWSSTKAYVGGDEVVYEGIRYKANYWTQNNNPAQSSDPYEEWTNLGSCDGGGGGDTNTIPSVSLTSPAAGSTFTAGETITLSASASDADGSVSKVEFYQGGVKLSEDTSSPYSYSWASVAAGTYSITAKAYDNDNAVATSASVTITVNTTGDNDNGGGGTGCDGLPSYTAGSSYTQGQEVSNAGGVYECNIPGWCSSSASWAYEPGVGQYWQDAWSFVNDCNDGGNGGGDNESPSVAITAPSAGSSFTAGTPITISASASDNDGTIAKVEFYRSGVYMGEDTSSPYSYTWSNNYAGNFSLTAVAYDNSGASTTSSAVAITVISNGDDGGNGGGLPARILNGYWHNFNNGTGFVKLRDVSDKWDVINISFAEPTVSATDGNMGFALASDAPGDYSEADFRADIQLLQSRGKKIIISIGGANGAVRLESASARDKFKNSMIAIIEDYGFDGMDIDFEGHSLSLDLGDDDFANPTTPLIINTIDAIEGVCDHFGDDFILTMAPETFFVQLGYSFYGGISEGADRRAGAYLPVIHALRDKLTFLQVQYYNSGAITALDNTYYNMGNSDFYVSLVDMILKGFPLAKNGKFFPPLRQDQVLLGVPAANGAGGGFIGQDGVKKALDYLIKGQSFGGSYQLSQTYPNLRGLMTWSINWDMFAGNEFADTFRPYLDQLSNNITAKKLVNQQVVDNTEIKAYPNPFEGTVTISFNMEKQGNASVAIYDHLGKKVEELVNREFKQGKQEVKWNSASLPSGLYFYEVKTDTQSEVIKVYKK